VQVNFGDVILNTTASRAVTLVNQGSDACQVSSVAFTPSTDPGFTIDPSQAPAFTVAAAASQVISFSFGAFDSTPPHVRTGTLVLHTGDARAPTATIPLTVTITTVCSQASQWIYTVDSYTSMFSRFDPATLTFTDITVLDCPSAGSPFSMAVDQHAVAWVVYNDGNLFKVDTATGACEATSFVPEQHGIADFGMGFVFQPSTGVDTLYVAGDSTDTSTPELATVAFPSLVVTPVGTLAAGDAELTGTGDGGLWGFVPAGLGPNPDDPAVLVQIDPASGATLASFAYPTLPTFTDWAVKFWGGSFWIFLDSSVWVVARETPQTITNVIADTGRHIVGAGVSTCAPIF
jgi:hypothetical protein